MKKSILLAMVVVLPATAFASKVAIIDSGTDYRHPMIQNHYWKNTAEIAANNIDDDNNGYVDDVLGWNFAESNNLVIDYAYLGTFGPDVSRFFEIQTRILLGTATEAEKEWMKAKKADQAFLKELSKFGNFAHGTHVAGITVRDQPDTKVFAAKLIPTEVKLPFSADHIIHSVVPMKNAFKETLLKMGLAQLAKQNASTLKTIGAYVAKQGADVANGSFGSSYTAMKPVVEQLYNAVFKEEERSAEQLERITIYFLDTFVAESKAFVDAAPNTLFVFAAGNDGTNNDQYPASPANVKTDNTISVAATMNNKSLATFSNFGEKLVDVAAPGVGILSAIPGDEMMVMSGTSMAAPYVANVAAQMKTLNPSLKPAELKMMLMGTVDNKEWLRGKVKAGGFVNPERAFAAASLSRSGDIYTAIAAARRNVADMDVNKEFKSERAFSAPGSKEEAFVLPLPSSFR